MILAGDIGGTKTAVGLWDLEGGRPTAIREQRFPSAGYGSLEEILDAFLSAAERSAVRAACFGVAGPVVDGVVKTTNLPWVVSSATLSRHLGGAAVRVANDLEATAMGILHLSDAGVRTLHPGAGDTPRGNVAVIAAGTGLGEASLVWDGQRHLVVPSEGGHASFAPRTELEVGLLYHLQREHGRHVSWERVLSGPGLADLYAYLRERGEIPESPAVAAEFASGSDPAAAVTRGALEHADPLCRRALEVFVELYGAEASNLALKVLSIQGVFVAGGIAPRIVDVLAAGSFLRGFADKGRFRELLLRMPVRLVLDSRTALLGAAFAAAEMAR